MSLAPEEQYIWGMKKGYFISLMTVLGFFLVLGISYLLVFRGKSIM